MRTMTWSPDTCECTFRLEYDDTVQNPQYNLKEVIRTCDNHSHLAPQDELVSAFDENHLKNETMTALKNTIPEITETDEQGRVRLKDGEISFQFEGTAPNRTLRIISKTDISAYEQAIKDEVAANQVDIL